MHAALNSDPTAFADVRVLIFDLDGTLIDSGVDLALSVNATLKEMHRAPLPHDQIFGYVGQGAAKLIEQALGQGSTRVECEQALAFFLSYYREHMLDNTVTYPGVREALAAFDGMPMAVLTNKPVRFSRQILEGLGLAPYFRYIYGGNSFEFKKPHPIGMETLVAEAAVDPSCAMMVGDSSVDIQTARNAGVRSCGVTYGFAPESLREPAPDLLVDRMEELADWVLAGAAPRT